MPCRVTLTDNDHLNAAYPLGRLSPAFVADGNWHHLEANWQDLLRRTPYVPDLFSVSDLHLGDGGWAGNPEGATYWIDNFTISPCFSPAGDGFSLSWAATDCGGVAGYSYHWSRQPRQDADQVSEGSAATARFRGLPQGRMVFHIRAVDAAGNWGPTTDWLCLLDSTAPVVRSVFPEPGATSASPVLGIEFSDALSGVDPAGLSLTVNGRSFAPGQSGVELDLAAGRFALNWVEAGLGPTPPPTDQPFSVALARLRDFAGNAAAPLRWTWHFTPGLDRRPPLAPEIAWDGGTVAHQFTFESASPALQAAAPIWLDRPLDRECGTHVQRVRVGAEASTVSVTISGQIDTAVHRYLSFRYRFPPALKIDLTGVVTNPDPEKQRVVIKMTDAEVRPDYVVHAGRVDGILCDDRWHAAIVDLRRHLGQRQGLPPEASPADGVITALGFADEGFNWNRPGLCFYLDDLLVAGAGPAGARFRFRAADESGIAGFAVVVDRAPVSVPPKELTVPAAAGTSAVQFRGPGLWYVHATARDGAGNWSQPSHYPYVVR
jgi:hypothetical protein